MSRRLGFVLSFALTCAAACFCQAASSYPAEIEQLRRNFLNPPDNARIMMRWWWFGPAVSKPELARELQVMKNAGIGGVEIQPVYPLALDDPDRGFRNLPYLSEEFIDALRFAARTARDLGMRIDITLGSGWPYGGPHTPITEAAGRLRCDRVIVPSDAQSVPIPYLENGEKLIAAFLENDPSERSIPQQIPAQTLNGIEDGRIQLSTGSGNPRILLFFISSRTGQQVKRAGVGGEGYVLDHYDRQAIEHHLTVVGDRLMQAFGANPPYAVFSDSLEAFGSDWTPDFLSEFRKRRGYDLTPRLPALIRDMGPDTLAIRHDWGETLTELAEENYLTPVREWAHRHHTLFRSQTYGIPPVVLSSNALVDLPEGEAGLSWRSFGPCRWASSASHLYGKIVTSSETWTWLHSPPFRATTLDMKADADLHFLQGINQLVGHGWPYSPTFAGEPSWHFYASAALNEHNPWFDVMPEITRYLQRVSFLLRQGRPANDVAVYLPTDDAWAAFTLGKDSIDRSMNELLGPNLGGQILNAGYNFDFIDDGAIASTGIPYAAMIIPGVHRIPLATLTKLEQFVRSGGILIATRRPPSLAPGLLESSHDTPEILNISHRLFDTPERNTRFVPDELTLSNVLAQMLTPDFSTGAAGPAIGFVHRKLPDCDIYFVVNTSNQVVDTEARVRTTDSAAEWWDPMTGATRPAEVRREANAAVLDLKLEPYESEVLLFLKSHRPLARVQPEKDQTSLDIGSDWKVTFSKLNRIVSMPALRSWTDDEATRFYSGQAVYEKTVQVPESFLKSAAHCFLDFGPGTPVAHAENQQPGIPSPALAEAAQKAAELGITPGPGTRAWLESPVRETAVVYVNGKRVGSVWRPPYRLDVMQCLHPGENSFRIVVSNLAINEMAGQARADYRLLNLRYSVRFTSQNLDHLVPLPAGILGTINLISQ